MATVPRGKTERKPYHHRRLKEAVIESALAEIEVVGPARLSMREIARRAGVSHAAPAHHFGDKRGIFTAIATQGFDLLRSYTEAYLPESHALLNSGLAYIGFAASHRAHFEIMFRPDLYDIENPDLQAARIRSFEVLHQAVGQALRTDDPDQVMGTAIAAWSAVHGFAALWLSGNFPADLVEDLDSLAALVVDGIVALGRITKVQAAAGLPAVETFGVVFGQ